MKVYDIIKASAELLGLRDIEEILNNTTEENEAQASQNRDISRIVNLLQFSIQEMCTNYISVVTRRTANVIGGSLTYRSLINCLRVQNVFKDGSPLTFKVKNRTLYLPEGMPDGSYEIEYSTFPVINGLFDEIDFLDEYSFNVAVLGLCAYYSIAVGMFDEFSVFHEQYMEKAESIREMKVFNMPARSWE